MSWTRTRWSVPSLSLTSPVAHSAFFHFHLNMQVLYSTKNDQTKLSHGSWVIMGVTAYVDFLWETPDGVSLHRTVLSMDRRYHFHVFTHTFVTLERPLFMTPHEVSEAVERLIHTLHDAHGFTKGAEDHDYQTTEVVQRFLASLVKLDRPGEDGASRLGPLPPPHFPRPMRLMSYNVWNFNKEEPGYARRIQDLTDFIAEVNPDVVCLQELRFDFTMAQGSDFIGPNQIDHLTARLPGYQFIFQPAMSYPANIFGRVEEGLGILSKHPVLNYDYILLPRDPADRGDYHQRICLHAEILLPGFPVTPPFCSFFGLV